MRVELRLTTSIELVRGDGGAPIELELTADGSRVRLGLLPVRVGLEVALDLGEPAAPPPLPQKSDVRGVRPGRAPTHTGLEG